MYKVHNHLPVNDNSHCNEITLVKTLFHTTEIRRSSVNNIWPSTYLYTYSICWFSVSWKNPLLHWQHCTMSHNMYMRYVSFLWRLLTSGKIDRHTGYSCSGKRSQQFWLFCVFFCFHGRSLYRTHEEIDEWTRPVMLWGLRNPGTYSKNPVGFTA